MPKVSILICTYNGSKYLGRTLESIANTVECDYELLVDCESLRTGIESTPMRYQSLFTRAKGMYIVKSDDDVLYFPGWLQECIASFIDEQVAYVCPLNHHKYPSLQSDAPIIYKGEGGVYEGLVSHQPFVGGLCWVFKRWLWETVPYSLCTGFKNIDSRYGRLVRERTGKYPTYLNSLYCSHLGTDRSGGVDHV